MFSARQIIFALGFAGLIPFVIPAIALSLNFDNSELALRIVDAYAFGIICFLCGSWWGMALHYGNRGALLLSNVLLLTAFFVYSFGIQWWALTACLLLIGLLVIELNTSIVPMLSKHYRNMRTVLTLAASCSMLVIHLAR